jgi:hypothetical protein
LAVTYQSILHAGLMKAGSTSIQAQLANLSQLNVLDYCGIRPGDYKNWYSNSSEAEFFETLLRYASNHDFERQLKTLEPLYVKNQSETRDFWVSCENISGNAIWIEANRVEKLNRIKRVFGEFSKIVIVYRPLIDLMGSWFWEIQKRGISASTTDFLDFLITRKHEGFVTDIFPSRLNKDLNLVFPRAEILFFCGVGEVNKYIAAQYPSAEVKFEKLNSSVQKLCIGNQLDLWSDRDRHRYLWSLKHNLNDDELFFNLRKIKESHIAAGAMAQIDLSPFIKAVNEELNEEKELAKAADLTHILEYFMSSL